MQLFLLDRNTNQNHKIEHISPLPGPKGENQNPSHKEQDKEKESFLETVATDYQGPEKLELRSHQGGQDIKSLASDEKFSHSGLREGEDLTHPNLEFVNQNQLVSSAESRSEAETASFKDSQDFLAIVSQLNKTLENIKNQERIIKKGRVICQP